MRCEVCILLIGLCYILVRLKKSSMGFCHSQLFIYRNEAISVAQYLCFMLSKGKLLTSDIENVKGLKITQDISLH